jgi:hypothetical protein
LSVAVPPIHVQRAIGLIVGPLDDKIELNRHMNETLEVMARALFKSWFVDFDSVRAKAEGRAPALPKPIADLFPARLVDSEFGEIPEGWEIGRLDDALVLQRGFDLPATARSHGAYPVIAASGPSGFHDQFLANLFYEDVAAWLDLHEIRYTPNVKFTGKTGYDHRFDFVIPKWRQQPERIVKAVNRASRDTAEAVAFSWIDTWEVRPPDSRAYAMLNDSEQSVSQPIIDALSNYDVHPVRWGQRESVRLELAA